MKKLICTFTTTLLISSLFVMTSCVRRPSEVRAHNIMKSYFKKYARKYPESVIGQAPVEEIRILHMEENHKHNVSAYPLLGLRSGMALQTRFTFQKKPFGWRAVSWENLGLAAAGGPEALQR